MANIEKLRKNLESHGFTTSLFATKQEAADYMTRVNLTRQMDMYLYTTERRRKIQTQSDHHHGGGSSFRGSSGRSHGGGRVGKF